MADPSNITQILEQVRIEVLDLPDEVDGSLLRYVNAAVEQAEKGHNFRHMETTQAYISTEATRLLASLPARWKEMREPPYWTALNGKRYEFDWGVSESDMVRQYGTSTTLDIGSPQFLLQTETQLQLFPLPDGRSDYVDGDYRITVPYWQYSEENWWTINEPWYLIYHTAGSAQLANRDKDQAAIMFQRAGGLLNTRVKLAKRSKVPRRVNMPISKGVYRPGQRPRRGFYRGGGL
jgi:hypothetical protein